MLDWTVDWDKAFNILVFEYQLTFHLYKNLLIGMGFVLFIHLELSCRLIGQKKCGCLEASYLVVGIAKYKSCGHSQATTNIVPMLLQPLEHWYKVGTRLGVARVSFISLKMIR